MMMRVLFILATFFIFTPNLLAEIELNQLGTYETGVFDEGAAEIAAYDPETSRVFFTNGDSTAIDVINISNPAAPVFLFSIDVSETGGVETAPNSVDVKNGVVAVALENKDDETAPGFVAFFGTDGTPLNFDEDVNFVETGVLPDALKFNSDGTKIIVANEGEPVPTGGSAVTYPEGSMSLITIASDFASNPVLPGVTTTTAGDAGFDDRKEDLKSRGVKLQDIGGITPTQDMEPELATFSADGSTVFVTLQEANAFGVLDTSEGLEFIDVLPLGLKDHSKGQPDLELFPFRNLPNLNKGPRRDRIKLGGFSGLDYVGQKNKNKLQFVTIPDRGPNGETFRDDSLDCGESEPACRPFLVPDYQARIISFEVNTRSNRSRVVKKDTIFLTRKDGETPITGISNIPGVDERPVDGNDNPLDYDPLGGDFESITIAPDGSYWMVDEYRPAIYNFDEEGVLIERYVPEGTAAQASEAVGTFGAETLPSVYKTRRANRGFEAGALDTDNNIFYAFIQTPLANPDRDASDSSKVIRILGIDPEDGTPVSEYVYFLEDPDHRPGGRVDKMGDAVYAGDNKFYVIERDSTLNDPSGKKFIFMIDLTGATNILENPVARREVQGIDPTLEQMSVDEIVLDEGIRPVSKMKVLNLPSIGYTPSDKAEGITLLPDGRLVVLNDNDFGLGDDPTAIPVTGIIDLNENNKLDPSNEDDAINIANHPVFGMYQPDTIASCGIGGVSYYITANEGDAREIENDDEDIVFLEEIRIKDLNIAGFPQGIQEDEVLGRLKVTTLLGNLDGNGSLIDSGLDQAQPDESDPPTYEKLVSFGTRSFSIWDEFGNLVFDSGDDFEQVTAGQIPDNFNSDNDESSFDSRSDDKGPEPEAIACGEVDGKMLAFIGLERVGGIMVYDISDPSAPEFILYENNRDFSADIESSAAGDLGPESIVFVPESDSPIDEAILIVANEVSGTVTIYEIDD